MIKKSILQRDIKKKNIIFKYYKIRAIIIFLRRSQQNENKLSTKRLALMKKIQNLPRNSALNRLKNRCWKTGKARSYYRTFGLCRNALRELIQNCYLPGVIKASW